MDVSGRLHTLAAFNPG